MGFRVQGLGCRVKPKAGDGEGVGARGGQAHPRGAAAARGCLTTGQIRGGGRVGEGGEDGEGEGPAGRFHLGLRALGLGCG